MSPIERFPTVCKDGVVTHVIVPVEEFERLVSERNGGGEGVEGEKPSDAEIAEAVAVLNDPGTEWHDADDLLWEIVREGLGPVRKERGLTQDQLAALLGVSQPQVSRMERSLEGTSLRVLRRIASALAGHGNGEDRKSA